MTNILLNFIKVPILLSLFSLVILLTPTSVEADTLVNTFRITDDGTQQSAPLIFGNLVAYNSYGDIWGYKLDTKVNYPILQKPGLQFLTGFNGNRIIYEDVDDLTSNYDVRLYNIKTGKDILIAGGPGSQTSGVTNGSVVVYIDGGACGTLNLYKINTGETTQIFPNTCHPVRIRGNIVVFPVSDVNGTNIKGYYIDTNQLFDVTTEDGFQEVPSVWGNKVIWLHRFGGGYGDYNAIKMKNLVTGVVKTIYESSTDSLNWPVISDRYVVWSQSSAQHVGGVRGADLNTREVFEIQEQGPHQNSHTMPAIWKNTAVWMSFRTGNGDIYGSTFTERVQRLTLSPDEYNLFSAIIDSQNGFAYFGTNTAPCRIIKVRLSDFTRVGSIQIPTDTGCGVLQPATINSTHGYAYFFISNNTSGNIVRLRLSDFTIDTIFSMTPGGQALSAVIDINNNILYVGTTPSSGRINEGQIRKIDLNTLSQIGALNLPTNLAFPKSITLDSPNSHLHIAAEGGSLVPGGPRAVVKIKLEDFSVEDTHYFSDSTDVPGALAISPDGSILYLGINGKPVIYKIDASSLNILNQLVISDQNFANGIRLATVIQDGSKAYFTSLNGCTGAHLLNIDLINFQAINVVPIITNSKATIGSMFVDPDTGYVYLGNIICTQRAGAKGIVYKVIQTDP